MVFFDALRVKIRDESVVRNKAVHIALGVRADGTKEVLGLWIEQNEGAKFWLRVINEQRHHGVEDILLAVVDAEAGKATLATFAESSWDRKYAAIVQSWERAWEKVIPFYAFPAEVRKVIYTTNAIEALNVKLRRAVRARRHFPNDDAALKLLFLALNRGE